MTTSNLPLPQVTSSTQEIRQFFDKFFFHTVTFPSAQIDAVVGFFLKRGFEIDSARSISIILLNQSRIDNVNVFELLDSLKKLTDVQLNQIVAQVINAYREKTSLLGYRVSNVVNTFESRNILV